MPSILPAPRSFPTETNVLIIGAGACGLTAALAASENTADVLILERDKTPGGSTALSSGFVPAAGTRFQRDTDSAGQFARDITAKAKGTQDATLTRTVTEHIGPTLEWLADQHGLIWDVLDNFTYPGHSAKRMHAVPEKTGESLMSRLLSAAAHIPLATQAFVDTLFVENGEIKGVRILRPDGNQEDIACRSLILACNGFGGNKALVNTYIPDMKEALYFGHAGNQGDAIGWAGPLGAQTQHLTGYQGHGSVVHPHGILLTWALMMEGGIQVNARGERFANEHGGYSEASVDVLAQPGAIAFAIFDERLHELGMQFPDYQRAVEAKAVRSASTLRTLAETLELPSDALEQTLQKVNLMHNGEIPDPFGRDFTGKQPIRPNYFAVKVTGALFHTQGGLSVNAKAQVLSRNGTAFDNIYAGGGAACGVSGPHVSGYLSGNGLLTAFALGALAGQSAAH